MSKTYCRFCDEHFEGLYLECPDCENWLSPYPKPKDLYPEKQQNKLTTSETLTIGRMLSQHRTTKDWCEYIEQLINGRLNK